MDEREKRGVWISRAPRAAFAGTVVVLGDEEAEPLLASNVSETGILVASPSEREVPEIGESVRLSFELPQLETALQVEARVVRREDRQAEALLGLQFEGLTRQTLDQLRTYVSTRQGNRKN